MNRMMKTLMVVFTLFVLILAGASAAPPAAPNFDDGQWFRAALEIDEAHEIPFFLWLPEDASDDAVIRNGAEDIAVAFDRTDNGVVLDFPHYDSRIIAQRTADGYTGQWKKLRREGVFAMPFSAAPIDTPSSIKLFPNGFSSMSPVTPLRTTRWKIAFDDSGPAIGVFTTVAWTAGVRDGGFYAVQGTIETTTGDYRYLAGLQSTGRSASRTSTLQLSVFDGAHSFLVDATIDQTGQHMTGDFYSGNWFHETFTATRLEEGDDYQLPDPFSEVALTSGDGKLHIDALDDPRYLGKPVIVQIFGTWCPNCHEETPTLVDLYNSYHEQGLEVLGLAYEVTGDDERSRRQVERFKAKYSVPWQIVIAGTSDKEQASTTLPDISEVKSFPTTIWIGRDGKVRAIHSGFSGAATGDVHTKLLTEFDRLTREIVASP